MRGCSTGVRVFRTLICEVTCEIDCQLCKSIQLLGRASSPNPRQGLCRRSCWVSAARPPSSPPLRSLFRELFVIVQEGDSVNVLKIAVGLLLCSLLLLVLMHRLSRFHRSVVFYCLVTVGGSYTDQQLEGFMLVAVPLNAQDETTAIGTFQVVI